MQTNPEIAEIGPESHFLEAPFEGRGLETISPEEILARILRASPWIALLVVLAVLLTGAWLRWLAPRFYTAQMTVAPYSGNLEHPEPSLFSLTKLLPSTGQHFVFYLQTRDSVELASRLMKYPELRAEIFHDQWDPKTQSWHPPRGVVASFKSTLDSVLRVRSWSPPTPADLAAYLAKDVKVTSNVRRTHYTFSYASRDPAFAAWLLGQINDQTQSILRERAKARAELRIAHLLQQITATTVAVNRDVLVRLLAEQQQRLMLINPKLPYAAIVIDPPSVSHYPTSPRPFLDMVLAAFSAAVLGIFVAGWRVRRNARTRGA